MNVKNAFIGFTLLLFIISFFLAFTPYPKPINNERVILSSVHGYISTRLPFMKILKIKAGNRFLIEIYEKVKDQQFAFLDRFDLTDALYDSHIDLHGLTTNLLLSDVNRDSKVEILVPFIDKTFSPRLFVLSFNDESKKLLSYH